MYLNLLRGDLNLLASMTTHRFLKTRLDAFGILLSVLLLVRALPFVCGKNNFSARVRVVDGDVRRSVAIKFGTQLRENVEWQSEKDFI